MDLLVTLGMIDFLLRWISLRTSAGVGNECIEEGCALRPNGDQLQQPKPKLNYDPTDQT